MSSQPSVVLNRDIELPPRPIELLALFVALLATAKDAPSIMRLTGLPCLAPQSVGNLIDWAGIPRDTVLFWLYISLFLSVFFWFIRRERLTKISIDDDKSRFDQTLSLLERMRWIRLIRSFGLVLLREWILGKIAVVNYGTFLRSKQNWIPAPKRFNSVDRIHFIDGRGVEFQYLKGHRSVAVRCYKDSNDYTYGREEIRHPTWSEIRLLLVASNFFPWWFIVHIFKRWINQKTEA